MQGDGADASDGRRGSFSATSFHPSLVMWPSRLIFIPEPPKASQLHSGHQHPFGHSLRNLPPSPYAEVTISKPRNDPIFGSSSNTRPRPPLHRARAKRSHGLQ